MRIYLAGAMRGHHLFNFPGFFSAALHLRALGHAIDNPAERDMAAGLDPSESNVDASFDLGQAFSWDFSAIIAAQAVVVLPGWEQSQGVRAELLVAHFTGTSAFAYDPSAPNSLRPLEWLDPPSVDCVPKRGPG